MTEEERPNKDFYSTAAWNAKKGIVTPMTCGLCPWTVVGTGPFHFSAGPTGKPDGRPVHVQCHLDALAKEETQRAKAEYDAVLHRQAEMAVESELLDGSITREQADERLAIING